MYTYTLHIYIYMTWSDMYVHASALLETHNDAFLTVWLPGSIYSLVLGLNMLSLLRLRCACKIRTFSNMDTERYSYCWLLKVPESCGQDRTRWLTVPKLLSLRCFCSCFWNTLDVELLEPVFAGKINQNDQHPQFHLWFIKVSWCKCKGNCVSFTQSALRTYTRHVPRCSSLVLWQFYGHVCVSFPLYSTRKERTSFCDLDSAIQHYKTFISW